MPHVSRRYAEILSRVEGRKVLDVGIAGQRDFQPERKRLIGVVENPGWMHGRLRRAGYDTYGVDVDEETINYLRSVGLENVFVQNAEELDRPEGPFDTIVAGEVIEHLANPGMFLARARQHLAPGGRIVLTTPNPFSLLYMLRGVLRWPDTSPNPEHVAWFCPGTMKVLAERSGLEVMEVTPIDDYEWGIGTPGYRLFVKLVEATRVITPARLRGSAVLYVLVAR